MAEQRTGCSALVSAIMISPVHVRVTISWLVNHPKWGCVELPVLALMDVRPIDFHVLENIGKALWKLRTKLELASEIVEWCVTRFQNWLDKRVLVVAHGVYAKRPFSKCAIATVAVVVSRLRKGLFLTFL